MAVWTTGTITTGIPATPAPAKSPVDLESPDLTNFVIPVDGKGYTEYGHQAIWKVIENRLEDKWRVVSVEQRSETLRRAMKATIADEEPVYTVDKILGTFDIVAVENGPRARMIDEELVALPVRKLRLKAELAGDGTLKIVESDVDAPKRRGYF